MVSRLSYDVATIVAREKADVVTLRRNLSHRAVWVAGKVLARYQRCFLSGGGVRKIAHRQQR